MDGARSILLSITGGRDLSLWEVNEAAKAVSAAAHPDANIIFGAVIDDALGDEVRVTVIAAGFDGGTPSYRPSESSRKMVGHQSSAPLPAAPAPVAVAATPAGTTPPPRRVLFDDVDVPDFLKNGS